MRLQDYPTRYFVYVGLLLGLPTGLGIKYILMAPAKPTHQEAQLDHMSARWHNLADAFQALADEINQSETPMNQLTHELKVVTVTNDLKACPEYAEATAEYPRLVKYVGDQVETFIVDPLGGFWPADEFFDMVSLSAIAVDPKELEQ